jgi:hypothetical protein
MHAHVRWEIEMKWRKIFSMKKKENIFIWLLFAFFSFLYSFQRYHSRTREREDVPLFSHFFHSYLNISNWLECNIFVCTWKTPGIFFFIHSHSTTTLKIDRCRRQRRHNIGGKKVDYKTGKILFIRFERSEREENFIFEDERRQTQTHTHICVCTNIQMKKNLHRICELNKQLISSVFDIVCTFLLFKSSYHRHSRGISNKKKRVRVVAKMKKKFSFFILFLHECAESWV